VNGLRHVISRLDSFRAILILGLLVDGAGLVIALLLCIKIVLPFASACLQACASNPALMALARGSASLVVAVAVGSLLAGSWVLAGQWRATRRLVKQVESRMSTPPRSLVMLASRARLERHLVYVSDPAAYAFCYGFLSPRICISSGMARKLSRQELMAVLLHEGHHLRHRDPLKVLVSRMVAGTLFALPTAAELRDRFLVEKELAADAHVLAHLSPEPLASALLKLCRAGNARPVEALAAAAVGPFNVLGERIRHLAQPPGRLSPLRPIRIAASLAVVVVVLLASVGSTLAAGRSLPAGGSCCGTGACATGIAGNQFTSE